MRIDGCLAQRTLREQGDRGLFPKTRDDPRLSDMALLPPLEPSFTLEPGCRIFTIGSCFARNIEEHLGPSHDVPTLRFAAPRSEWLHRPNGLLNEYNAGTIAQRIERALHGTPAPDETIVADPRGGYVDLLLPGGPPVSFARAHERRREIDAVYEELALSQVVIVTLGLAEAWVDKAVDCYLNRMPPTKLMQGQPGRYVLEVMDLADALPQLERALALLAPRMVLASVSPVPLGATFSGQDVIVANAYSKALLRVCAQRLAARENVDYFPAYEVVSSAGLPAYDDDNIHVRDDVVARLVQYMLSAYSPGTRDRRPASPSAESRRAASLPT